VHKNFCLDDCPVCGHPIMLSNYTSGRKFIQTLDNTIRVGYRHGQCTNVECLKSTKKWRSSQWQQLAPLHSSYGFDVIARIGWLRVHYNMTFECIHQELSKQVSISESQVRHLYHDRYLPLIACSFREQWFSRKNFCAQKFLRENDLEKISAETGLILSLDGLAPEGGEPQLWLIRELYSGLVLRSGWLSKQDQNTFENFLRPLADAVEERDLKISGIMSDKERGLVPAIEQVFPNAPHGYCQSHYFKNLAEPVAESDEQMKKNLRQLVREEVGDLIKQEESNTGTPGVLTVTGLIPSQVNSENLKEPRKMVPELESQKTDSTDSIAALISTDAPSPKFAIEPNHDSVNQNEKDAIKNFDTNSLLSEPKLDSVDLHYTATDVDDQKREEVVKALLRRTRYLLTLKGRPPFRLAGCEMYERLSELSLELDGFIDYYPEPRLMALRQGLNTALPLVTEEYHSVKQGSNWLYGISEILDPDKTERTNQKQQKKQSNPPKKPRKNKKQSPSKPKITGAKVKKQLFNFLDSMSKEAVSSKTAEWALSMRKTTENYKKGLFHTYKIEGLPRTNNTHEGIFREYKRHLLRSTGQIGTTRRFISRSGAWEILNISKPLVNPTPLIANIDHEEFASERERIRQHRGRFRWNERAAKWVKTQIDKLKDVFQYLKPKAESPAAQ
jgi:hypothetical protein